MVQETHLSVSWDAYQKSICNGLSLLQQRGEFVDMTLAADGHHVKVHQIVLSLVSPYIKDLISTAQCPHPVIFLNNISYNTLCSILEYIYTGEVLVSREKLSDLITAGKALHIKGLGEMDHVQSQSINTLETNSDIDVSPKKKALVNKLREYEEINKHSTRKVEQVYKVNINSDDDDADQQMDLDTESLDIGNDITHDENVLGESIDNTIQLALSNIKEASRTHNLQYSVTNQGGLQIIVNRFIYSLKYVHKRESRRVWRCAESAHKKCPAIIYTNARNQVIKRTHNHSHPFHDDKILKKMHLGTIFTAYNEAETAARNKKSDSKDQESSQPSHDLSS